MNAPTRRARRPRFVILIFSLLATFCVVVGVTIALAPWVQRARVLRDLQSAEPDVRMRAMVNICRRAAEDEALFDAVADLLADESTAADVADAGVKALQCAEVWGPAVGLGWVKFLERRVVEGEPVLRTAVALEIAEAGLHGQAVVEAAAAHALLAALLADEDANVRYAALRAAATTARAAAVAAELADDEHATVARLASIVSALAGQGNVTTLVPPPGDVLIEVWRETLTAEVERALRRYLSPPQGEYADVIAAAAASGLAPMFEQSPNVRQAVQPIRWTGEDGRFFRELALLENLPAGSVDIAITQDMPDLVRVAAVRAAKDASEDQWLNTFDSDHAGVRHLAALAALRRLDRDKLQAIAKRLNRTFYDNERMGGAMLVGLAGLDANILRDRLSRERQWVVQQHVKLGLLMLGQDIDIDFDALLARSDMPRQSVMLAQIHTGRIEGLDTLFRPLSGDAGELRDMLDHQRFWPIVKRYLPDNAPRFDLWADPALQQFQCDVLRTWYLMNRSRLNFDAQRKRFTTEGHREPPSADQ